MQHFRQGVQYLLAGFGLIKQPKVRFYVMMPLLINTILFATVTVYGANNLESLIDYLTTNWPWLEWLTWLLWPIFVVVICAVVFFCFSLLANLIGAPFNGLLAMAVEHTLRPDLPINNALPLPQMIIGAIQSELQKILYFVIRALPLLVLFIIPGINIVAPLIWLFFSSWMLAIEYTDYPMGNHDILFKTQRQKLVTKKSLVLGFGMGIVILAMIPIINFVLMPVAVAGATKMYVEQFKTEI